MEEVLGYSLKADFQGNVAAYAIKRRHWLQTVTICTEFTIEKLQKWWISIPTKDKWNVLSLARNDKDQFCRELATKPATG